MKITLIDKTYYTSSTGWNTAFADKATALTDAEWERYAFLASTRIKNIVNKYFENLIDLDSKERVAVQEATAIMIDYWMEYGINLNRISGSVSLGGYSVSENPPADPDYIPFMVYEVLQTAGLYTFAGMAFSGCDAEDDLPQYYQWNGLKYPFKFAVYADDEADLKTNTNLSELSYGYNKANQHWYVFENDQWKDLGLFTQKGDAGKDGRAGVPWLTDEYADLNVFANNGKLYDIVKYNINADGTNNVRDFTILIKTPNGVEEMKSWAEIKDFIENRGSSIPKGTLEEIYKVGRGMTVDNSDVKYANIDELGKLMAQNFETNGEKMVKTADNIVLYSKGTYHNGLTNGKVRYMDAFSGIFINSYDVEITDASLFYQYTYKSAANIWNRLSAWQSAFGAKSLHNETTVNYHFNDKHNYKFSINKGQTYEMTIDDKFESNQLVKYLTLKTNGQLHGANGVNHTTAAQSADGYQIKLSDVMTPAHPNADIIFTFKTDINEGDSLLELEYTSPPQALVDRYSNAIKNAATKAQIDSLIAQVAQLGTAVQNIENTWTGKENANGADLAALTGDKGAFDLTAGTKLFATFEIDGLKPEVKQEVEVLHGSHTVHLTTVDRAIDVSFNIQTAPIADGKHLLAMSAFASHGTTDKVEGDIKLIELMQNPKSTAVIDAYTKAETDTKLGLKADKTATYDRTTLDAKFTDKADAATTYSKTEVDTELGKKANQATTYTKTETNNLLAVKANQADVDTTLKEYVKKELLFAPTASVQPNFILFDETAIKTLPINSEIKLDMADIDTVISNPANIPAAGDQAFIGTRGAIRIPNTAGTAALKWETKTNATDVNVKDNYKDNYFVLTKKSETEYDFVRLEKKPVVLDKAGIESLLTLEDKDIERLKSYSANNNIIAVGYNTGGANQKHATVAVGWSAGAGGMEMYSIAIGEEAGGSGQGEKGIAIGYNAGGFNQGESAIAIGAEAGHYNQPANSIVMNASADKTLNPAEGEILVKAKDTLLKVNDTGIYVNGNKVYSEWKDITSTLAATHWNDFTGQTARITISDGHVISGPIQRTGSNKAVVQGIRVLAASYIDYYMFDSSHSTTEVGRLRLEGGQANTAWGEGRNITKFEILS